jgi:hypothetical protein
VELTGRIQQEADSGGKRFESDARCAYVVKVGAFVLATAGGLAALSGALMVSPFPTGALDLTSDGPSLPSALIGFLAAATAVASAVVALRGRYLAALAVLIFAAVAQAITMFMAGAQPLPVSTADMVALGLLIGSGLLLGIAAMRQKHSFSLAE